MGKSDSLFVEAYRDHYRALYAYFRRRLPAEMVDDAIAETFLVAWRKIDEMPAGGAGLPWLYGVAHRILLHQWRSSYRAQRLRKRLHSLGVEPTTAPEDVILLSHESRRVLDAASKLKPTDQEVLRLSIWEDLSHDQVAAVLGLRVEAVRQRYSRALKNLTKEFNRQEGRKDHTTAAQEGGVW